MMARQANGKRIVWWLLAVIAFLTTALIVLQQKFWNSVEAAEEGPSARMEVPIA